jgi:hypothetical protein
MAEGKNNPAEAPADGDVRRARRQDEGDGRIVRAKSSGETPEGREGTGGGAHQPRIELGRLALADHASKVLRQRHRLCQVR